MESINQSRERIFAKRMLPRRPVSSRVYLSALRERKKERKRKSVLCVCGVEKMAPFFPMENVKGKSLATFIIIPDTRAHKSTLVVKTSIHPRDRQKKKRKKVLCRACGV